MTIVESPAGLAKYAGQELGRSDWITVEQSRIDEFARATGDFQWIHVDIERATKERGGTIAHGYLVLSLIPVMHEQLLQLTGLKQSINYGLNKVRFLSEVPAGSRLRLLDKVKSVEPKGEGILVTYEFTVEIEGGSKPACVAEGLGLLFPD